MARRTRSDHVDTRTMPGRPEPAALDTRTAGAGIRSRCRVRHAFELEQRSVDAAAIAALTGALEAAGIGFAATNDDEIVMRRRRDFG